METEVLAETLAVVDPRSGLEIGRIPAGCADDARAAAAAARQALPAWSALGVEARAAAVRRLAADLRAHEHELAELESRESGKPVELALDALRGTLAGFETCAEAALGRPPGSVVRRPYGVAALIVPWNFPLAIALDALAPLLLAGNTVVWKPSEKTPLSALRARELAGLPLGVLEVLTGDGRAGAPLVELADLVVFTGSVATGRRVGEACGRRLVPALLELGGKDPVVVDAGVEPAWAARQVADGAFLNAGQICTSMERVYVHRAIAGEFVAELVRLAGTREVGPMIDEAQRAVVDAHVTQAIARGARVLAGGEVPPGPGFFYPPTVLIDVTEEMLIMREETFGPVAPVRVVDSFEEGVALAAGTEYGLGATVLTADPAHARLAEEAIPAALLWVNEWWGEPEGAVYEPAKSSGMGAVGPGGWLDAVSRPQTVHRAAYSP